MPQQRIDFEPIQFEPINTPKIDFEPIQFEPVSSTPTPTFGSRIGEFGSGLMGFGSELANASRLLFNPFDKGAQESSSNILSGLVGPFKTALSGHPLKGAAEFVGLNPDNIWNDYQSGNIGALIGDIGPQAALGGLAKFGGKLAIANKIKKGMPEVLPAEVSRFADDRLLSGKVGAQVPEVIDQYPQQLALPSADIETRLGLPAFGESSAAVPGPPRFYQGAAGTFDEGLAYPHNLSPKYGNTDYIVPDIGAELASGRTIAGLPFKDPRGPLAPTQRYENIVYGPGGLGSTGKLKFKPTKLKYNPGGEIINPPESLLPIRDPLNTVDPNPSSGMRPKPSLTDINQGDRIIDPARLVDEKIKNGQKITNTEINQLTAELPKSDKKAGPLTEAFNLPRALMSWDLTPISSATFRQGFPLMHKEAWRSSWNDMVKAYGSDGAFRNTMDSIKMNPNFKLAQDSKLSITDLLNNREEAIMSSWAEKVKLPGTEIGSVRASNRAYTAYLDKLRMDTFSSLVDKARRLGKDPDNNLVLTKQIADFVNNATGRGSLGKWAEKNGKELNAFLFSPKMLASRLQMINPKNYLFTDPMVRVEYWKSLGTMATTWTTVAALAKMGGAEVSLDPESSDFGKIKIGNTRIDPAAGFQQEIVFIARELAALKDNVMGEGASSYNYWKTMAGMGHNFGANKLNPPLKVAHDFVTNNPFPKQYWELLMPMTVSSIIEAWRDDPELGALVAGINTFLPGIGTQTYED
jgi:hypothetical protein